MTACSSSLNDCNHFIFTQKVYKKRGTYGDDVHEAVRSLNLRFFTPREIANLMCFPQSFSEYLFKGNITTVTGSLNYCDYPLDCYVSEVHFYSFVCRVPCISDYDLRLQMRLRLINFTHVCNQECDLSGIANSPSQLLGPLFN